MHLFVNIQSITCTLFIRDLSILSNYTYRYIFKIIVIITNLKQLSLVLSQQKLCNSNYKALNWKWYYLNSL